MLVRHEGCFFVRKVLSSETNVYIRMSIFVLGAKKETPLLKLVLQKRMNFTNSRMKNHSFNQTLTGKLQRVFRSSLLYLYLFAGVLNDISNLTRSTSEA